MKNEDLANARNQRGANVMIVTFGSPKGGVGKTTASLTLANAFRIMEPSKRVALIDTDLSVGSLSSFARRRTQNGHVEERTRFYRLQTNDWTELSDLLDAATTWAELVIIDVQGTASGLNVQAASISDMLIIPTRLGATDMEPAIDYLNDVQGYTDAQGLTMEARLLLTFLSPPQFMTRFERMMFEGIPKMDLPVLKAGLAARNIYKDAQNGGRFLHEIDGQSGPALLKATDESVALYEEITATLRTGTPEPSHVEAQP
jgi:chromosome partitioning protein